MFETRWRVKWNFMENQKFHRTLHTFRIGLRCLLINLRKHEIGKLGKDIVYDNIYKYNIV